MKLKREFIGIVGVDSASFLIMDPGYLSEWKKSGMTDVPDDADEFMEQTYQAREDKVGGQVFGDSAVVIGTCGDGGFPVYAVKDKDGNVVRIEIDV